MPVYRLGPRGRRVYDALRGQIIRGELAPGTKLPPHGQLAVEYGVAPLTVRHVLAELDDAGLISRRQGRGTFVREQAPPLVLVVEDDVATRGLLEEYVTQAGHRVVPVAKPDEALGHLAQDRAIGLVFANIRMPETDDGVAFIRAVRRRWPDLPLVAVVGDPADLVSLHGTPEWPVLILGKPFWMQQIAETLRMALPPGTR